MHSWNTLTTNMSEHLNIEFFSRHFKPNRMPNLSFFDFWGDWKKSKTESPNAFKQSPKTPVESTRHRCTSEKLNVYKQWPRNPFAQAFGKQICSWKLKIRTILLEIAYIRQLNIITMTSKSHRISGLLQDSSFPGSAHGRSPYNPNPKEPSLHSLRGPTLRASSDLCAFGSLQQGAHFGACRVCLWREWVGGSSFKKTLESEAVWELSGSCLKLQLWNPIDLECIFEPDVDIHSPGIPRSGVHTCSQNESAKPKHPSI